MEITHLHTLVIGSGAAGLASAVRLHALGVSPIAIYTEGIKCGTSINTGSDKQTYYKLGMYGSEADSPALMAADLMAGGAMHGDIALIEAALSAQCFSRLSALGVPFPHDEYGQAIGYKTDHDPKRRATSCGPYTSKEMCLALLGEVRRRRIPVCEHRNAVKLLTMGSRCIGAVFIDDRSGNFEAVTAENVVFAAGGPGGLYENSVYPKVHTGAIGLALEAGAPAGNLAESQFGLASLKFRWNVSGSYMQALPRFISVGPDGNEREFLRDYFATTAEMYDAIFLKGYQWPFAAGHVPGSSLIDVFVHAETMERKRRVYLDYRSDPGDLDLAALSPECQEYLRRSGAVQTTPLARLAALNAPAIELYRDHKIDLAAEPLEVAVCAQHCNGGLEGTIWWESTGLHHLFPVGEINGTHGVTRPGGSALNAGQVGAFRAAEAIARRKREAFDCDAADRVAVQALLFFEAQKAIPATKEWKQERKIFQHRMSEAGAFVRSTPAVEAALDGAYKQYAALQADGLGALNNRAMTEALRNRHLLLAQIWYLECILMQIDYVGSRGGSLVLDAAKGVAIHPKLGTAWRMVPENPNFRDFRMVIAPGNGGYPQIGWERCRPIPESDGWFETVWKEFREGKIYG